jgi:hypothetical protein
MHDDVKLGAKLASFAGTPVALAIPLSPDSWLTARLKQFGEAPCAFILGSKAGHAVRWADTAQLGWHLGFETE